MSEKLVSECRSQNIEDISGISVAGGASRGVCGVARDDCSSSMAAAGE